MHKKHHAQYDLCDSGVYSREIINMSFVGQVSGLVENVNIGIFPDNIIVINFKLCVMVLLLELYLFLFFSVTLTIFQGHSSVNLSLPHTKITFLSH